MSKGTIILLVIIAILAAAAIALYFLGKRLQKKQEAQQAQIEAYKQTVNILVIDKKRLKLKESGLPQAVIDESPKLLRRSKLPIVRAKIGNQIMNLVADEKVFDLIPVKKEVRATISGIYITDVKGLRGAKLTADDGKSKSRFRRFVDRLQEKAGAKPVK